MHKTRIKLIIFTVLSALLFSVFSKTVRAQAQEVQTSQIEGRVTKKDNKSVTIDTGKGIQVMEIPDNVRITKNGVGADFNQVQVGDRVSITASDVGEVLGVQAISGKVADTTNISLPIIGLVLLLLAAIYYFWRRSSQGKIKTESSFKGGQNEHSGK